MTTRTRRTLTSALAVAALGMAGCSGSPGTPPPAARVGGITSSTTTSGGSTGASASPTTKATAKDPRAHLPSAKPVGSVSVSYAAATSNDKGRLAPVQAASADLIDRSTVRTITVGGRSVGVVGVYTVKKSAGRSPIFQDQYVVQLINAVTGRATTPQFVKADGQVLALSTTPTAVAGWFTGDTVTLVYRQGKIPDLAALALAVRSSPVRG